METVRFACAGEHDLSGKNLKYCRPGDRQSVLADRRNLKMARSAHAYIRGNTSRFYDWLDVADKFHLPEGPPIWICGDCHVSNLGPIAGADGQIAIHVRDFDQTVIGNPAHDLIRLSLSLASAARGSDLPGVTTAMMLEQLTAGYSDALEGNEARDKAGSARPDVARLTMKEALGRSWKDLARERIENSKPNIPLGKRFWPLSREEKREIEALFGTEEARRLATCLRGRADDAEVQLLDAAFWVKGCSSLGRLRYAALLRVDGSLGREGLCLMDIKEAVQAAPPRSAEAVLPRSNADRVVEGARHITPSLGKRMSGARLLGRSVFLRELLPEDLMIEIDRISRNEAMKIAHFLAAIVGRSHARQLDDSTRRSWRRELGRGHSKRLDAPSWLWSSVVALLADHEAGYLEHCRKHAMEAGALRTQRIE